MPENENPIEGKAAADHSKQDEMMLAMLRDILLREDRKRMDELKDFLENSDHLAEHVEPIINYHIERLKQKFPRQYRKEVERVVERKIKSSQDELLDLIYPIMGKMVRKFVAHQILELRETIDQRINTLFSLKGMVRWVKSAIFGIKGGDMMLGDLNQSTIQEVYLIERDSGLLIGHYSRSQTIDSDLIAGMFTAIKSFVEDAFSQKREELEMIEYGTYKIHIQSFHQYYAAVVMDGNLSSSEKERLSAKLLDFAEQEIQKLTLSGNLTGHVEEVSKKLKQYFKSWKK